MPTEKILPGPPDAFGVWASSPKLAREKGARLLRLQSAEVRAHATGLVDSRRVLPTRYVVRPQ